MQARRLSPPSSSCSLRHFISTYQAQYEKRELRYVRVAPTNSTGIIHQAQEERDGNDNGLCCWWAVVNHMSKPPPAHPFPLPAKQRRLPWALDRHSKVDATDNETPGKKLKTLRLFEQGSYGNKVLNGGHDEIRRAMDKGP